MSDKEKINRIESVLYIEEGIIDRNTLLSDIEEWNSITKLSLIVFFEDEYGVDIGISEIQGLNTIGDILDIMPD